MTLGKQAKILTDSQQAKTLKFLATTRHPFRNKVIFLLSVKAGLRAKEIASITWGMVTDSNGKIGHLINIADSAAKGKSGGVVWMNNELRRALVALQKQTTFVVEHEVVVVSERGNRITSQSIVNMFAYWYRKLGFKGCTSHSGRRTFITNAAKRITSVGGSMRDVQMLARHASLNMTMRYIEADVEAMRKVVQLV